MAIVMNNDLPAVQVRSQIDEAVAYIRRKTKIVPEIGIILGSGLGGVVKHVRNAVTIPYGDIPHFPVSTVAGHSGKLMFGTINGRKVVVMQGRFHRYEGYTAQQVVFPVRVMSRRAGLGVKTLIISNAAGGLNPQFRSGDLMILTDHINLQGANPLVGRNDESLGVRFPDMSEPYSKRLQDLAERVALDLKIPIHRGVYVSLLGPSLETRAEMRFLRTIGADAVGMSVAPEDIAAVHLGMEVFAISVITNECFPDALKPASHEGVVDMASKVEPEFTKIISEMVRRLPK